MKKTKIYSSVAALSLLASSNAFAAFAIGGLDAGAETTTAADDSSLGYDITIGPTDLLLTAIGYYDPGGDGLESFAEAGLFELGIGGTNEGLVVSQAMDVAASFFDGDYRYVTLASPVTLTANVSYRVAANTGSVGGGASHNTVPFTRTPNTLAPDLVIDLDSTRIGSNPGTPVGELDFPSGFVSGGAPDIFLANLEYSVVPEPTSALLVGLAALGMGIRRRR